MAKKASTAVQLYRIMRRAVVELVRDPNREFLLSTLNAFSDKVRLLSNGRGIYRRMMKIPKQAIQLAFRHGTHEDIDVMFSILPGLLRYTRAIQLIRHDWDELYDSDNPCSVRYNPHDIAAGALLISKLYYSETELKQRNLKEIYANWLQRSSLAIEIEYNRILRLRQGRNPQSSNAHDELRLSIYFLVQALNTAIRRDRFSHTVGGEDEHLVDQLLQPTKPYLRASPIAYSASYCSLINRLGIGLQAFGVSFPTQRFFTRIVVQPSPHTAEPPHAPPSRLLTDLQKGYYRQRAKELSSAKAFEAGPVAAQRLTGHWLCVSSNKKFAEMVVRYNSETNALQAYAVQENGLIDPSRMLWQVPLNKENVARGKVCLALPRSQGGMGMECDYVGDRYRTDILTEGLPPTKNLLCFVRFMGLSPSLFGPEKYFGTAPKDSTHFEMHMRYEVAVDPADFPAQSSSSSTPSSSSSASRPNIQRKDFYFCKISELDWCMLDLSEQGAVPIPALGYMSILQREGYSAEDALMRMLEPATRISVAERLAENLTQQFVRSNAVNAHDERAYWSAVRKQLATMNKEEVEQQQQQR